MFRFFTRQHPPVTALLATSFGVAGALALIWTNPSFDEYEAHAGDQLVLIAAEELCDENALSMLLRLWVKDCSALVTSQRGALADLAGRFTTRWNFGIGSLYVTQIGSKTLLPGLSLPEAEVVSLGLAGRFVILRAETNPGFEE